MTTEEIRGSQDVPIIRITLDSRHVEKGTLFFAIRGTETDGHRYISAAIQSGACAVICEELPDDPDPSVTWVRVKDSAAFAGLVADRFYDSPSASLKLVAVTGTNGKTTIATLLYQVFQNLGYKAGLISTVHIRFGNELVPATHTTPDAISLQAMLRRMADAGITHVFMEASSHAIHQRRVFGCHFAVCIFSNITHDHLDYHQTFENYIRAKKQLFDDMEAGSASLINLDDKRARVMVQNTKSRVFTYSLWSQADIKGKIVEDGWEGLHLSVNQLDFHGMLSGQFNASNYLAVFGAAVLLGEKAEEVLLAMSRATPPDGRFQTLVSSRRKLVGIVDYAHTPDALGNVLDTIQKLNHKRSKIVTVVGCGGNRDAAKRPVMADVASRNSDAVILTSDNPRNEEPDEIIRQMEAGVRPEFRRRVHVNPDRKGAIRMGVNMLGSGDILLVAGKGHEKYQEIKGVKHPFDDKEILQEALWEADREGLEVTLSFTD